jgi:putative FmdB family regulatory protein
MPIYDYRCGKCRHEFEQLVRGEEKLVCPKCQGAALERLVSLTARPVTGTMQADAMAPLRPSGGCCGGSCGSHSH